MPGDGNGLKLIQRAAKRLTPYGKTGAPVPVDPTLAPEPARVASPANPDAAIPVTRDKVSEPAPMAPASPEDKPAVSTVRLKLAEMRLNGIITPDNLASPIAQEFRAIKRKLLGSARNQKTRAIDNNLVMITSALPGEGKTFTAMNLAISLAAERDLHVLLIDGDVIHPTLSSSFEPRYKQGLVELLSGQCRDAGEVIHRCSDVPNLSVIFAGQPDVRTPELMSSRRMADVCRDVSSRYQDRIVIIDTPPVLASAEPAAMAAHVHQTIMVVASYHSSRTQVQTALEHLTACPNISLLFNKAPEWSQTRSDNYYYYHRAKQAVPS
jgi:protein-tyrosine kinase